MHDKRSSLALIAAIGLLFWGAADPAAARSQAEEKKAEDQAERAQRAADVLRELTNVPEEGVPRDLLAEAEAIAVIPHVVKAAFGIGGSWGKGLISVRNNRQWSPPVYINMSGGSFGFQIGGQATDIVLVFTDREGIDSLLNSKLKLGVDAAVTAGPVGRTASAGTDMRFESGIYSYSRSKGLFAGVALDGAVITIDDSGNEEVYGSSASARDTLQGGRKTVPAAARPFVQALNQYVSGAAQAAGKASPRERAAGREASRETRASRQEGREVARADIPKNLEEQAERASRAAEIMRQFSRMDETGIPRELLERAYGIAVIPNVVRAAFGVGGRWGKGLLTVRENGQWRPPAFIDLAGGSFGLQIGGSATDLVLVFTEESSVKSLMESKLTLGADASVAAGPVGRSAAAGTDAQLNAAVYSYSRSKGLFAGVALDGVAITMDESANEAVYGEDVSGEDILVEGKVTASPVTMPFLSAVRQTTPRTGK